MTISTFKTHLLTLTDEVYHYFHKPNGTVPYIVYAEDSANDFLADNHHGEKSYELTVDLFTQTENDPLMESIPTLFDSISVYWRLESVQYEEDTGYIHLEWVVNI